MRAYLFINREVIRYSNRSLMYRGNIQMISYQIM